MKIEVLKNPDRKITQSVLYFQFRFMGWSSEDIEEIEDRYSTLPIGYCVAYEGDKMVGVGNVMKREIQYNGKKIHLGGLGGGCTHIDHRNLGVSNAITKKRLEFLKDERCDVAFLCTSKHLISHYQKLGFTLLKNKYKATGLSGKEYLGEGGMIAPLCSKDAFDEILADEKIFDLRGQDW